MVTRQTGEKSKATLTVTSAANVFHAQQGTDFTLQIRSMIIEYNFFMASMYFRHSVRRLACIIWSSLTGN